MCDQAFDAELHGVFEIAIVGGERIESNSDRRLIGGPEACAKWMLEERSESFREIFRVRRAASCLPRECVPQKSSETRHCPQSNHGDEAANYESRYRPFRLSQHQHDKNELNHANNDRHARDAQE